GPLDLEPRVYNRLLRPPIEVASRSQHRVPHRVDDLLDGAPDAAVIVPNVLQEMKLAAGFEEAPYLRQRARGASADVAEDPATDDRVERAIFEGYDFGSGAVQLHVGQT